MVSKRKRERRVTGTAYLQTQKNLEYQRAVNAVRSFYSNAVAWGTDLVNNARDEVSLDDATAARLYGVSVTAWAAANYRAQVEGSIPVMIQDGDENAVEDHPFDWFTRRSLQIMTKASMSLLIHGKFYCRKIYNARGLPVRLEYLNPLDVSPLIDYTNDRFLGFRIRGRDEMLAPNQMVVGTLFDPLNDFDGVSAFEVAMHQIVGDRELARFAQKYFQSGTMLGGMLTYNGELTDSEYQEVKAQFEQFKGSQNAFKTFIAGGGLTQFDYKPIQPAPVDLAMTELKDIERGDICTALGVNPMLIGIGTAADPLSAQSTFDSIKETFVQETAVPRVRWILEVFNDQWLVPDYGHLEYLKLVPDLSEIDAASKSTPERSTTAINNAGRIWTVNEARDYTGRPPIPTLIQFNPDWPGMVWRDGGMTRNEYRAAIGLKPLPQDGFIWDLDPRASGAQSQLSFHLPPPGGKPPEDAPKQLPSESHQDGQGEAQKLLPEGKPQEAPTPARSAPDLVTRDAMLHELDSWRKKVEHRGIQAPFEIRHLPDDLVSFIRAELDGHWSPREVFKEAKRSIRDGNTPNPLGATPEQAQAWWRDFDGLKHDLGQAWLAYMQSVGAKVFDKLLDGHPVDLDKVFAQEHQALVNDWVGTPDKPGDLLKIIMAGYQAGGRAIQEETAADPGKPRALIQEIPKFDLDFNLVNQQAFDFAKNYSYDLIKNIDTTTRDKIRDLNTKYVQEGWDRDTFEEALTQVIPGPAYPGQSIQDRAENIAQTESMRAYNGGAIDRWEKSGIQSAKFNTVRDNHVCPICRPLHGEIGDIARGWSVDFENDSFGFNTETRTPPMHPRCRCFMRPIVSVAALSPSEMKLLKEQLGIKTKKKAEKEPQVEPDKTEPDNSKKKTIREALAADRQWLGAQKERLFAERDKAKVLRDKVAQAYQEVLALYDQGYKLDYDLMKVPKNSEEYNRIIQDKAILDGKLKAKQAEQDQYAFQVAQAKQTLRENFLYGTNHTAFNTVLTPSTSASSSYYKPMIEEAQEFLQKSLDGSAFNKVFIRRSVTGEQKPVNIEIHGVMGRDFADGTDVFLDPNSRPATAIHEIGHSIESLDENIHQRCVEFLETRAEKLNAVKLNSLPEHKHYDDNELVYKDKFPTPYCGKVYKDSNGKYYATEILSMGLQYMYSDAVEFQETDPEYFDFILSIMKGRL